MKLQICKIIVWPLSLILFVGFLFVGHNDILCIGEDGRMKFETECLPCCNETEDICNIKTLHDFHDEHEDSSDCSDLTMDGALWSKRLTKINLLKTEIANSVPTFINNLNLTSDNNITLQDNSTFLLTFYKSPQSFSIATTILRC